MPFITRNQMDVTTRAASNAARKAQLRQALLDPALTEARHQQIREELANLGQPRVYSADAPPKPGAVSFASPEQEKRA